MDLRILEIASNTENNKIINNFTHQSKNKNPICGDEMEISLVVKNDTILDMGYQCKSCVYCQASVSLLSQKIKNKNLGEIRKFITSCENIFEDTKIGYAAGYGVNTIIGPVELVYSWNPDNNQNFWYINVGFWF